MRHCPSCTCGEPLPISLERARQKKLYKNVPDVGCLRYRVFQGYCGEACVNGGDYCKEHEK